MNRDYVDGNVSSTITKFIGKEVEFSAAYGLSTLFVLSTEALFVKQFDFARYQVSHVYLNANHSDPYQIDESVMYYLQSCEYVRYMTIEVFDKEQFEYIQQHALQFTKILIMWSVAIPNVMSIGNRVTIKLDDSTFNHSNPGVYCMSALEFITNSHETKWNEYTQDAPI